MTKHQVRVGDVWERAWSSCKRKRCRRYALPPQSKIAKGRTSGWQTGKPQIGGWHRMPALIDGGRVNLLHCFTGAGGKHSPNLKPLCCLAKTNFAVW
jgi:hypothetical protein